MICFSSYQIFGYAIPLRLVHLKSFDRLNYSMVRSLFCPYSLMHKFLQNLNANFTVHRSAIGNVSNAKEDYNPSSPIVPLETNESLGKFL